MIEDPRFPALIDAVRQSKTLEDLSKATVTAMETFLELEVHHGPLVHSFYSNMVSIAHAKAIEDIKRIQMENRK